MGGRGAFSASYQGKKFSTARGDLDAFAAVGKIHEHIKKHWKIEQGEKEAISQLDNLRSSDDMVTIYRAAPANHINTNDWVFLSKQKADRFAHSLFRPDEVKHGYKVLVARVKASDVRWTEKNLEFAYVGKRVKG